MPRRGRPGSHKHRHSPAFSRPVCVGSGFGPRGPPRNDRRCGAGMKFGPLPLREAEGAILAHSLKFGATALKKGRLLSAADIAALTAAEIAEVTVARLDAGEI